ncbi:unnamed protein product, partial [Brassica oleracea]
MNKNVVLYYLLSHSTVSIAPGQRNPERSRDKEIVGLGCGFPSVLCFDPFSVTENTRRQRDSGGGGSVVGSNLSSERWGFRSVEDQWSFGGSVVVLIGGGFYRWRIGGGFYWWWWRWVSPLSFERRKQEDTATKTKKKRK